MVLGTRYGTLWPWYGLFNVGSLQAHRLLSGAEISWINLVLVSSDTDLYLIYRYIPLDLNLLLAFSSGFTSAWWIVVSWSISWGSLLLAIIRESFRQLAASRLTILEMAVDDRWCPHCLFCLTPASVDCTMRSLSIAAFTEFGQSFFSNDHSLPTPSKTLCIFGSYSCVPSGKLLVN